MSIRIGELIDSEVSQLLIDFTDRVDRAEASVSTGVGTSTLRDITYRTNVVTERNFEGLKVLLRKAEENAEMSYKKSRKGKKEIKAILDTI